MIMELDKVSITGFNLTEKSIYVYIKSPCLLDKQTLYQNYDIPTQISNGKIDPTKNRKNISNYQRLFSKKIMTTYNIVLPSY